MIKKILLLAATLAASFPAFSQSIINYVLATAADVEAGGEFIMASSTDLSTAFVASAYNAKKAAIVSTTAPSDYGVVSITKSTNDYGLRINGERIGIKEDGSTTLSDETNYKWRIVPQEAEGCFLLSNIKEEYPGGRRLQFSLDNGNVANYSNIDDSSSDYSTYVYFFREAADEPEGVSFTISSAQYTTLYSKQAFVMPAGVTGGIVTETVSAPNAGTGPAYTLCYEWAYEPGSVVPACTPLMLKGAEGRYEAVVTDCGDEAPEGNMLHGTTDADGNTYFDSAEPVYYYKLAYKNATEPVIGFWWGEQSGGPFACAEGKAYLAVPQSHSWQVRGFSVGGAMAGIDSPSEVREMTGAIYAVDGRQVLDAASDAALGGLPRGVYIVKGRKVYVR